MPITINPSDISIGSDAAVVIHNPALHEKIREAFVSNACPLLAAPNFGCSNGGNCLNQKNLGSCSNTGACAS